ncbi:hypothetical protein CRYUN_Cryun11dG0014200 [Craigia yunnanensis]
MGGNMVLRIACGLCGCGVWGEKSVFREASTALGGVGTFDGGVSWWLLLSMWLFFPLLMRIGAVERANEECKVLLDYAKVLS